MRVSSCLRVRELLLQVRLLRAGLGQVLLVGAEVALGLGGRVKQLLLLGLEVLVLLAVPDDDQITLKQSFRTKKAKKSYDISNHE